MWTKSFSLDNVISESETAFLLQLSHRIFLVTWVASTLKWRIWALDCLMNWFLKTCKGVGTKYTGECIPVHWDKIPVPSTFLLRYSYHDHVWRMRVFTWTIFEILPLKLALWVKRQKQKSIDRQRMRFPSTKAFFRFDETELLLCDCDLYKRQ